MDYPTQKRIFQFEPVVPEISVFKQTNSSALYISIDFMKMLELFPSFRKLIKSNQLKRLFSSNIEPNENAPIKFSTSEAAKRRVVPVIRYSRTHETMPWYQPFSVVGSIAVFLIYFCILREENDMDQEFNKTLYDRIKGLEKHQLLQSYQHNKEHGKSVADIEKRLKEIEEEEAKLLAQ